MPRYIDADAPTIEVSDVPEKHVGKWIKMSDANGVYWSCSACGYDLPRIMDFDPQFDLFPKLKSINKTKFCPDCGVRME